METLDVCASAKSCEDVVTAVRKAYKDGRYKSVCFNRAVSRTTEEAAKLNTQLEAFGSLRVCFLTGWVTFEK